MGSLAKGFAPDGSPLPPPRFRLSGDRALIVVLGAEMDPQVNDRVHLLAARLEARAHPAIEAVVPAYATLAIHYDPDPLPTAALMDLVADLAGRGDTTARPAPATVILPVCYGGDFGPDLDQVAAHAGLDAPTVIRLHSQGSYRIYAIGFAPGFCYLGGLDPRLHTPRLATPRLQVPAGSVGIAGSQTGVYPLASPGGWQLIGRTPLPLFTPEHQPPIPYRPGDILRFRSVGEAEFRELSEAAAWSRAC